MKGSVVIGRHLQRGRREGRRRRRERAGRGTPGCRVVEIVIKPLVGVGSLGRVCGNGSAQHLVPHSGPGSAVVELSGKVVRSVAGAEATPPGQQQRWRLLEGSGSGTVAPPSHRNLRSGFRSVLVRHRRVAGSARVKCFVFWLHACPYYIVAAIMAIWREKVDKFLGMMEGKVEVKVESQVITPQAGAAYWTPGEGASRIAVTHNPCHRRQSRVPREMSYLYFLVPSRVRVLLNCNTRIATHHVLHHSV